MINYKKGDTVTFTNKKFSDLWKKLNGVSLHKKTATIHKIDKSIFPYTLKFDVPIRKNTKKYCFSCQIEDFSL